MNTDRPVILVVDDTAANLALMSDLLRDDYRVRVANRGVTALRLALQAPQPDLILLDVMMPELDGYAVCAQLKADAQTRDIPVMFLTARIDTADETRGFELGAVDYVSKPINPPTLLARVRTQIELKRMRDALRVRNNALEVEMEARIGELVSMQDVTISAMAALAETRDNETGAHIMRTRSVVGLIAEELAQLPRLRGVLPADAVRLIAKSAPLHDIGKIGISDAILLKKGRLTPEEFEIMKTHATIGRDAIRRAAGVGDDGELFGFLRYAEEIAWGHHEKFDGSGYPRGLAGTEIPISARIMAVADVYDALISRRVYKPAWPHERAIAYLCEHSGRFFDPDVVRAFLALEDQVVAVSARFRDPEDELDAEETLQAAG